MSRRKKSTTREYSEGLVNARGERTGGEEAERRQRLQKENDRGSVAVFARTGDGRERT
jgi:hypothetical protein